jgi:predicted pyridoxine 5'-phosphate oxidase superfamily flavin-nucleotide-binding protein
MIVKGHRPRLALVVEIEQIFFHCAKAFLRSALWKPDTWGDQLPSHARLVKEVQNVEASIEQLESYYGREYTKQLYAT